MNLIEMKDKRQYRNLFQDWKKKIFVTIVDSIFQKISIISLTFLELVKFPEFSQLPGLSRRVTSLRI